MVDMCDIAGSFAGFFWLLKWERHCWNELMSWRESRKCSKIKSSTRDKVFSLLTSLFFPGKGGEGFLRFFARSDVQPACPQDSWKMTKKSVLRTIASHNSLCWNNLSSGLLKWRNVYKKPSTQRFLKITKKDKLCKLHVLRIRAGRGNVQKNKSIEHGLNLSRS